MSESHQDHQETTMVDANLPPQVATFGQRHILQIWDELTSAEKAKLCEQLDHVDWTLVESFHSQVSPINETQKSGSDELLPPSSVVRKPKTPGEFQLWSDARKLGEDALRAGKVAAILLAGGQGTRLGFPHPKGMFPLGPVSGKSLFGILAEQIVALTERFDASIPYLIMTSDGTHEETINFFEQNEYFGLNRDDVYFFQQGFAPSLDAKTGELLLAEKGAISMNPDGHGGLLSAILKAGLFEELKRRGVEYLFSHQVDNPLVKACDPEFLGLHLQFKSDVSTKVVAKTSAAEKVGVAVNLDGRTAIIEYSDLPIEAANLQEPDGELRFWAGSTAIHLFNRSFLEQVATSEKSLPWHRALKKIPFIDRQGQRVQPEIENGIKFERFLFDTLPLATTALIVETIRSEEFAPLKNKSGDFSPEYVRQQMIRVAANWLKSAGIAVPENAVIEIGPRFAMNPTELASRKAELVGIAFDRPVLLDQPSPRSLNAKQSDRNLSITSTGASTIDPIVFDSFYRPQIWGGRGLKAHLGRDLPDSGPYGEAWDLSPQQLHVSRVTEGVYAGRDLNDLWAECHQSLAGNVGSTRFPLLIKWLECRELLSLQVHPDDQTAKRVLNETCGKSEVWVVILAEPTARIFAGLKPGVTRADVEAHLKTGTLAECLHSFTPSVGDCISLPAGTIHAAGGGLMVAEVQQASDATFRLFDWNRLGLDGTPRTLHVEKALEAVDWNQGAISPVIPREWKSESDGVKAEQLVDSFAFRLDRFQIQKSMSSPYPDEFTIWMVLDGNALLLNPTTGYRHEFKAGATVVIPKSAGPMVWESIDAGRILSLLCTRLP